MFLLSKIYFGGNHVMSVIVIRMLVFSCQLVYKENYVSKAVYSSKTCNLTFQLATINKIFIKSFQLSHMQQSFLFDFLPKFNILTSKSIYSLMRIM